MNHLPPPPIAADVDLRGSAIPVAVFVDLAMKQFGVTADEAERLVLDVAASRGVAVDGIGHA